MHKLTDLWSVHTDCGKILRFDVAAGWGTAGRAGGGGEQWLGMKTAIANPFIRHGLFETSKVVLAKHSSL